MITTFITCICLLFLFLSAITTDGLLTILGARQTPHWLGGPFKVACLGLRWFGGISSSLGNALCPFTKSCHGLVKNTLRWSGNFFYGLGNGLCDFLVHMQLRYGAQMRQLIERQRYLESKIDARNQTITARDTTIAADKLRHQCALEAKDAEIIQKDQLLTAARQKKNELLDIVSRKDIELANEKAASVGLRADIHILEDKSGIHSGNLPSNHDAVKKSDALGTTECEKMAVQLELYKSENDRLQRQIKHMVNTNEDLKSERDRRQKKYAMLRNQLDTERSKNAGLESDVAELKVALEGRLDRVSKLCQDKTELQEKLRASKDQNVNQQCDLLHAQGIITDTRDENERLQKDVSDRLKQLGQVESTNSRLQAKIDGAEKAKKELEGRLTVAFEANTHLQSKMHDITNAKTELEGQLNGARETNTQCQAKVQDIANAKTGLEGQLNGAQKTNAELQAQVQDITNAKAGLEGQLKGAQKTDTQLQAKVQHITNARTELLSKVHGIEGHLASALRSNSKLLRQAKKDKKEISRLKTALRKANLKIARLQRKATKSKILRSLKSTKLSKKDSDDQDWECDASGSDNNDDGDEDSDDEDHKGSPAPAQESPATTPTPSIPTPPTPPPSTLPPSSSSPSTPPSSTSDSPSPSCDIAPPSHGNARSPSGDDSVPRSTGSDSSTASLGHCSSSPRQDSPSRVKTPVFLKENIEATPDIKGSSGSEIESREVNGASNVPVGSSADPSPLPAQDAAPASTGNPMDDKGSGTTFGGSQGDNTSTVPVDPSSTATDIATPQTDPPRSVDVPKPTTALPSTPAECIVDPDVDANSAPSIGNTKTSESDYGSTSTTLPPSDTAEHSEDDHKIIATPSTGDVEVFENDISEQMDPLPASTAERLVDTNHISNSASSKDHTESPRMNDAPRSTTPSLPNTAGRLADTHMASLTPPTSNIKTSEPNDTLEPTSLVPATTDKGSVDTEHVAKSAPSTSIEGQAEAIDAALVPLPGSPTTSPTNLLRSQESEERLQASYALHGLPNIDAEGLGEGEREDLAREKLDLEDEEQEVDYEVMDTGEDSVWKDKQEDVDMEDFNGLSSFKPSKPDQASHQAPAPPSNIDSRSFPAAIDDGLDYLFEGDDTPDPVFGGEDIDVDKDNDDFYGPDTTHSHEPTPTAGNASENKPENNVEMGEAGPLDPYSDFSNAQGNAGPVATPQQAPFIPPSQPAAPTFTPASTYPGFGTVSPFPGFNYQAVYPRAGEQYPTPGLSTLSQKHPDSTSPSQPSTAPLYNPTPAFSTSFRNARQPSFSTPQPATPFGSRFTPEELRRGPSAFQASHRPSEIPRLNPRTTPTSPSPSSFFGGLAQSTNPLTTPPRPRSSSSSSSESESEQPTATSSSSTAGPSAPPNSATPNGKSAPMALPGLGLNSECDYTQAIGTPINLRPIAQHRARRMGLPAEASTADPDEDDIFAANYENEMTREAEAREASEALKAQAGPSNFQAPTEGFVDISDEELALMKQMKHEERQEEIKAKLRVAAWPALQFRPRRPGYSTVETDWHNGREEYMAEFMRDDRFRAMRMRVMHHRPRGPMRRMGSYQMERARITRRSRHHRTGNHHPAHHLPPRTGKRRTQGCRG